MFETLDGLAVAQTLYGAIGERIATKDPDNARGKADADLMTLYRDFGVTSVEARVNGRKVGTFSLAMAKERPARTERSMEVEDAKALADWCEANPDAARAYVLAHAADVAEWMAADVGEVPAGCAIAVRDVPSVPARPKGTTLRIPDAQAVADALGDGLPEYVAGLLGGGGDE